MSQTTIVQAIIESYDSGTHTAVLRPLGHPTATVGPLGHPTATVGPLLVAGNIAPALLIPGARVIVLLYADVGGAVIAAL